MRDDLLALTVDGLAALTNRGLVKRAAKSIETGDVPTVRADADGTLHGDFADGISTVLPPGGLDSARCTCDAVGLCRHTVTLVLACQASATTAPDTVPLMWSPGDFTDDQIEAVIGRRALAAARRAARTGYVAQVFRPTAADPVPRADLPSATVRFLVPNDLGYVRSDAARAVAGEAIALAVWAFRVADSSMPTGERVRVEVGAGEPGAGGTALGAAADLAGELLLEGAVHSGGLAPALTAVARALEAEKLRWPLNAVTEIGDQLSAYAQRSARYRAEDFAELLAEIQARQRVTRHHGPRSSVLGVDEPCETPLRTVRLTGLGCRVRAAGPEHTADVFLADPATATILMLRHQWISDSAAGPTASPAARRVAGSTIAALAAGNVVTESAVRTASRRVRLPAGRLSRNSVIGSQGQWAGLPPGILVTDMAALTAELDRLPPRLIRPRVDAEAVRVFAVEAMHSLRYSPGEQRLDATLVDAAGTAATVSAVYAAAAPGALDALAQALPQARFVSGVVRRGRGGLVITPLAVVQGQQVVVPDLASVSGGLPISPVASGATDEVVAALDNALGLLAEVAHRGGRHLPSTFADRLRACAATATAIGLARCGHALSALAEACGTEALVEAWMDAQIRLLVAAESR